MLNRYLSHLGAGSGLSRAIPLLVTPAAVLLLLPLVALSTPAAVGSSDNGTRVYTFFSEVFSSLQVKKGPFTL
jgi:hypothetical protein